MSLRLVTLAAATTLAVQPAQAEVSATLGLFSDYDFRGVSQTEGDPAVQGSIDYAGSLFYIGAWASNVDFGSIDGGEGESIKIDGNIELDVYVGLAQEYENSWRWDVGGVWYIYPGSQNSDNEIETPDYLEIYAGGGWGPVDIKYWYSPDLYDSGETASYFEVNAGFDLPWELGIGLHAGYNFGDYFDVLSDVSDEFGNGDDADYIDYSLALTRSFGHFDFEVKYVATDADGDFEIDSGAFRNDERVILSVSTTWPWSEGE